MKRVLKLPVWRSYTHYRDKFLIGLVALFLLPQAMVQAESLRLDTLYLSLDEAVRIAMEQNFGLRDLKLNQETANQQVREAWANVYPQVNLNANFTRNIITANPFAGSGADDLFAGFAAIGWLNYNENARTDGDPSTVPITFSEYLERQQRGYEQAGISPPDPDDDFFTVDNQFVTSLSVTQTLFSGAAFGAIRGAEQFKKLSEDALHRERQIVIDQVRKAYFSALLARQQEEVVRRSVERLSRTAEDIRRITEQGLSSRFELLSAEVELVNLETRLIDSRNQAELAVKNLNLLLDLDVRQPVVLIGDLRMAALQPVGDITLDQAIEMALEYRPDMQQAAGFVEVNRINENIMRSSYRPVVSAFANLDYIGRVPDDRTVISSDFQDPFRFDSQTRSFFHDTYWNPNLAVGINVSWNLFSGFQNKARIEQSRIQTRKSELQKEFLSNAIRLEVDQALRNLRSTENRIESQRRNIEQAQVNYDFARTRLREGVGNSLEERQASMLLDQSQLSYLAAVHDYLIAVSSFELVMGTSLNELIP